MKLSIIQALTLKADVQSSDPTLRTKVLKNTSKQPLEVIHTFASRKIRALLAIMSLYITGDLWLPDFEYGPYLSFPMMGVPHDSGEGYLFEYHFNLQHMHFLRETNALVASQEQEILEYLNKGKYSVIQN